MDALLLTAIFIICEFIEFASMRGERLSDIIEHYAMIYKNSPIKFFLLQPVFIYLVFCVSSNLINSAMIYLLLSVCVFNLILILIMIDSHINAKEIGNLKELLKENPSVTMRQKVGVLAVYALWFYLCVS